MPDPQDNLLAPGIVGRTLGKPYTLDITGISNPAMAAMLLLASDDRLSSVPTIIDTPKRDINAGLYIPPQANVKPALKHFGVTAGKRDAIVSLSDKQAIRILKAVLGEGVTDDNGNRRYTLPSRDELQPLPGVGRSPAKPPELEMERDLRCRVVYALHRLNLLSSTNDLDRDGSLLSGRSGGSPGELTVSPLTAHLIDAAGTMERSKAIAAFLNSTLPEVNINFTGGGYRITPTENAGMPAVQDIVEAIKELKQATVGYARDGIALIQDIPSYSDLANTLRDLSFHKKDSGIVR